MTDSKDTPRPVKFVDEGWQESDGPEALEAWFNADPTGVRRAIADVCNRIAAKRDDETRDEEESR